MAGYACFWRALWMARRTRSRPAMSANGNFLLAASSRSHATISSVCDSHQSQPFASMTLALALQEQFGFATIRNGQPARSFLSSVPGPRA